MDSEPITSKKKDQQKPKQSANDPAKSQDGQDNEGYELTEGRWNNYRDKWRRMVFGNKLMVTFTFIIALCTIIYAIVSGLQWGAMLESNKINRESLQDVQRAFVTFKQVDNASSFESRDGKITTVYNFSPRFDNSGNTPAVDVIETFKTDWDMLPNDEPNESKFVGGPLEKGSLAINTIAPKDSANLGAAEIEEAKIFGKDFAILRKENLPITKLPCLWGWAAYRDIFPKTEIHVTEYCQRITGIIFTTENGRDAIRFTRQSCKQHNCTDNNCSDYSTVVSVFQNAMR